MSESTILKNWKKRNCVLATMHGKEHVISPELEKELGLNIIVPENFDTDRFGTFTGEIPRAGNQREAARAKVLAAMEQTGLDVGIASEGSFGWDPLIPLLPNNLEIVLLIDKLHGLEIIGHYRSYDIRVQKQQVRTPEEARTVAISWGFPDQGVIVRLSEQSKKHIYKDIRTVDELEKISDHLLSKWFTSSIVIETDMRAHRCPKRMHAIKEATCDLIKNCQSLCPKCNTPGFVITDTIKGLRCSHCNLPTDLIKETVYTCQKCIYRETRPIPDKMFVEPKDCPWCNP